MKARTVTAAAVLAVAVVLLAGCYYTGSSGGLSEVTVGVKQPAATIASVALIVTGADLSPIAASYPGTTETITMKVPWGTGRTFNLLVNTASVTFRGTQTVDLAPGEQKSLSLILGLDTTQIIVPDQINSRIVQVSDMSGTGWKAVDLTSFLNALGMSTFTPCDVDVDGRGRIYVGSYAGFGTDAGVIRFKDINDSSPERIVDNTDISWGLNTLAVDRANNYLYYIENTYSAPLDRKLLSDPTPGAQETFILTATEPSFQGAGSAYFSGMAVDENGVLYLAAYSPPGIFKYDPALAVGSRVVASYALDLGAPTVHQLDVWYSQGYVYVFSAAAPDGKKIQKLDRNLNFVKGYGRADDFTPPDNPGEFYGGAGRFLAIPGRKLYIIDDGQAARGGPPATRLVALDDTLTGGGWATYGSVGSGTDQFDVDFAFYSSC